MHFNTMLSVAAAPINRANFSPSLGRARSGIEEGPRARARYSRTSFARATLQCTTAEQRVACVPARVVSSSWSFHKAGELSPMES